MNAILRSAVAFLLVATPALADDPRPPQVAVSFLAEPAPIVQDGSTKLFYEMALTNYAPVAYVLDSVEAQAADTRTIFDAAALAKAFVRLGGRAPAPNRRLAGGESALVFLMADLGRAKAPGSLTHKIRFVDERGEAHEVEPAPLAVSDASPTVVAPPLRGTWIAGDSASEAPDAAHRRAVLVENGRAWIAQRFAIDFVQVETVDGKLSTWKGPEDKNDSYFCYNQPIYSAADGTVIAATDGMAENVPHSGTHAEPIDFDNAAGNHVVVQIAPHRYALYAHMRPGTVAVKAGQNVRARDLLGRVGNSGSSEEPHLHFHIDDQPSFLAGNGVPYAFTKGLESGPVEANVSSPTSVTFGAIGAQHAFTDDYPPPNALVTFE
ncbi:MAG TPA: M23 family metallopeptidase [Roseiarcus sp.]|nr:M23 family metallopeptidase [Roseiarcus sp.]